jgi:protein-arginine kinase activator protein McsA
MLKESIYFKAKELYKILQYLENYSFINQKEYKYTSLLKDVYANLNMNNEIKVDNINDIILDFIPIYESLKVIKFKDNKILQYFSKIFEQNGTNLEQIYSKEITDIKNMVDNIIDNYIFKNENIINFQMKKFENDLMDFIKNEEYEKCSIVQENINQLKNNSLNKI